MIITIRVLRGPLVDILGDKDLTVKIGNHSRVIDVLTSLEGIYGKAFSDRVFDSKTRRVKPYLMFALDGVMLSSIDSLETEVRDGNFLLIMSPTAGG